jgi:hypothetical protein
VSLCESSGGIREVFLADAEWAGTRRAVDAVSGWNDPRDLRSTGYFKVVRPTLATRWLVLVIAKIRVCAFYALKWYLLMRLQRLM